MIDQTHINLLELIPSDLKKVASTNGGEYAGACPMCGGNDRFRVQPNATPNPRWFCRKCNESGGDAIAFVQKFKGCGFIEAIDYLDLYLEQSKHQSRPRREPDRPTLPYSKEKPTASDDEKWQKRARAFVNYAEAQMWERDCPGRLYLNRRGFYSHTINLFGLGWNPSTLRDDWGLDKNVWLPAGLVIPYERGEFAHITKIRIRRKDWTESDKVGKYIPPAGVANTAYLTRSLLVSDYVVICEGELDAIIFKQEINEPNFVAMATGGTHGAKLLKYIALLSLAKRVFVAFDSDESGEKASEYWLKALDNAVRLVPTRKDINDMVLAGDDLRQWLRKAI